MQIAPSSSPRGAAYVVVVPVVLQRGSSRRALSQAALTLSGKHTSGATVQSLLAKLRTITALNDWPVP